MSLCNSCEDFLEDNRRIQKSICTQCTNSFCDLCSTRLFLNKQSTCSRCQFSENLLEVGFNPDHLDRFNIHDLQWVLSQHAIDYELNSDKDQLINVLGSFLANHSPNHGRSNHFNNDPNQVFDVEDDEPQINIRIQVRLKSSDSNEEKSEQKKEEKKPKSPVKTDYEPKLCKICLEAEINCVIQRCGHMMCCNQCGNQLFRNKAQCPICRKKIFKVQRIYLS